MADPIDDELEKALDLMVAASWIERYAHRAEEGAVIDWSDDGLEKLELLWRTMKDLGVEQGVEPATKDLWWQIRRVALMQFGDSPKI